MRRFSSRDRKIRYASFCLPTRSRPTKPTAFLSWPIISSTIRSTWISTRPRLLHVVMSNGTMATLTIYRNEQISAWTLQETQGAFLSVAAVGDETYVLVDRAGGSFIEVFDARLGVDAGALAVAPAPRSVWSSLDHLDGQTVKITADGVIRPDGIVAGGAISLEEAAMTFAAGLGFTHVVEPLPAVIPGTGVSGAGMRSRPVSITLRLLETAALTSTAGAASSISPSAAFAAVLWRNAPSLPGTLPSAPTAGGRMRAHGSGASFRARRCRSRCCRSRRKSVRADRHEGHVHSSGDASSSALGGYGGCHTGAYRQEILIWVALFQRLL